MAQQLDHLGRPVKHRIGRRDSSAGASFEATAILTVASGKASRSLRSSPANSSWVIDRRPRRARTPEPLSSGTGGRTSSTIRPKLASSFARWILGMICASR